MRSATTEIRLNTRNNYRDVAERLRGVPAKLTAVMQDTSRDMQRVIVDHVRRDIASIAGGVYWDIHASTTPQSNGANVRVFTPKSRAHRIEPKHGKALAFKWADAPASLPRLGDGRVLVRGVNHPGSRPPDWIIRFKASAPEVIKINYRNDLQRALGRL